ncbi:pyridoxamine 5'-phosphate oxidase family protein [Rhodovulum sp. DZ06]|uniref:pyridoxamine 5'-phosphate oxidase family protein n=1 Tax=Rhodovulum sp. DZ06 TaxID=3425126 RepID=UPI003D33E1DB
MFTDEILASAEASVLCWLATADAEGRPSVSPKEIFALRAPDEALVAQVMSPGSVRNVKRNPHVCLSFVDVFAQTGWKIAGTCELILPNAPDFAELEAPLRPRAGPTFPIRGIFRIKASGVAPIRPPSEVILPGRDPADVRAGVLKAYGVKEEL